MSSHDVLSINATDSTNTSSIHGNATTSKSPGIIQKALSTNPNPKMQHVKNRSDSFIGPDLKLFVKDVSDPHSKKRPVTVKTWSTVKDVKDVIQKFLSIPPALQKLYRGPLMSSGEPLPNHRSLHDAGIYKNGQVLYLEIKGLPSITTDTSGSSSLLLNPSRKSRALDLSTLKHTENDICISKAMFDITPKHFKSIIKQTRIALAFGIKPVLVLDGSGGTYFLHDVHKRKIAVFKPADEEPYAINNPRGYVKVKPANTSNVDGYGFMMNGLDEDEDENMSMRAGIKPGEACLREVAAFLLDKDGFSGVPMTTLVEARHYAFHSNGSMLKLNQGGAAVGSHSLVPSMTMSSSSTSSANSNFSNGTATTPSSPSITAKKVGSCQEFFNSECSMDDLSPSKLSIEEVHKIAILDIRIMNADRNTANLLCRRNPENPDTFELIPIDHGYCLRTVADVCWFDWCWLDWPQLKEPLSDRMKEYVLALDVEKDAKMLRERLDIPKGALDYFCASTKILIQGVKAGLTLYEIAILCCRNDDAGERPSKLETILSMSSDIAKSAVHNGRWHHAAASRALEQQLSPDNGCFGVRPSTSPSKAIGERSSRRASDGLSIFKSASSVNFSSFSDSLTQKDPISSSPADNGDGYGLAGLHNKAPPAPLASSSGSESSCDAEGDNEEKEEEEEECEKWAADFIADTLYSVSTPRSSRRQRAISFVDSDSSSSDDSNSNSDDSSELSKSPQGFWFVPPSASKSRGNLEDTIWSPEVSPNSSHRNIDDDGFGLDRNRSVKFENTVLLHPSGIKSELSSLSLAEQDKSLHQIDPKGNDGANENIIDHFSNVIPDSPPRAPMIIKRSQSYSAFSFKRISDGSLANQSTTGASQSTISSDEYEKYYQKFIDLLIDRETTHAKKSSSDAVPISF